MTGQQASLARNDYCSLQYVAQLSYIARPRITHEQPENFWLEIRHAAIVPLVQSANQSFGYWQNVFLAMAQRRHDDAKDVEAVVHIPAEHLLFQCLLDRSLCAPQHPHIPRTFTFSPQSPHSRL